MNEEMIQRYIQHLKDGKPILNKKRDPIDDKTAQKYIRYMNLISKDINKDFHNLSEDDVTRFRENLKRNKIKTDDNKPYSNNSKRDIEIKTLALFLKWLGRPELAYFTDDYRESKEIPTMTRKEIEKIIASCNLKQKVILAILYDGGLRADEFLNVKFSDLKDDERKGKGYYKIRITKSKTLPRTIGLYLDFSTEILDSWLELNQDKIGTGERLVSISYNHLRMNLMRLGEKVLKKKLYPHLLRHSSATYYCHKLTRYQLCKRYGWSMSSDMPSVYIDREGVEEEEIGNKINEEEAIRYKKEVNLLKEQMRFNEEQLTTQQADLEKFKKIVLKQLRKEIDKKII